MGVCGCVCVGGWVHAWVHACVHVWRDRRATHSAVVSVLCVITPLNVNIFRKLMYLEKEQKFHNLKINMYSHK